MTSDHRKLHRPGRDDQLRQPSSDVVDGSFDSRNLADNVRILEVYGTIDTRRRQGHQLIGILQPKYWCRHCKVYVRDSKIERSQHEATGRHQGNLKRFLRDLHRAHEKEARDKERAKAEVERLNGIVSGTGGVTGARRSAPNRSTASEPRQVTVEERKKQMGQLAELGVAIPEEYQKEMALAGEWHIVAEHNPPPDTGKEEDDDDDDDDEDEEAGESGKDHPDTKKNVRIRIDRKRKRRRDRSQSEGEPGRAEKGPWGSRIKTYSNPQGRDDELDRLLASTKPSQPLATSNTQHTGQRQSDLNRGPLDAPDYVDREQDGTPPLVKKESSEIQDVDFRATLDSGSATKRTDSTPEGIFFKRRKAKGTRQHVVPLG